MSMLYVSRKVFTKILYIYFFFRNLDCIDNNIGPVSAPHSWMIKLWNLHYNKVKIKINNNNCIWQKTLDKCSLVVLGFSWVLLLWATLLIFYFYSLKGCLHFTQHNYFFIGSIKSHSTNIVWSEDGFMQWTFIQWISMQLAVMQWKDWLWVRYWTEIGPWPSGLTWSPQFLAQNHGH